MKIAFNIGVSNVTNGDIQEWPLEYSSLKNTRSSLRFSLYAEWQCKKTAREKNKWRVRRRLLARTPPPPAVFSLAVLALPHPPPQLTERLDGWGESEKKIRFKSVKSDTNITYATIIAGWSDSWLAPKVLGGNWSDFILFYFNICKCKLVTRGFKDAIFFCLFN